MVGVRQLCVCVQGRVSSAIEALLISRKNNKKAKTLMHKDKSEPVDFRTLHILELARLSACVLSLAPVGTNFVCLGVAKVTPTGRSPGLTKSGQLGEAQG